MSFLFCFKDCQKVDTSLFIYYSWNCQTLQDIYPQVNIQIAYSPQKNRQHEIVKPVL